MGLTGDRGWTAALTGGTSYLYSPLVVGGDSSQIIRSLEGTNFVALNAC